VRILAIYDNGGKTLDRYTVVMDNDDPAYTGKWWDMLGLSDNPGEYNGFSQFTQGNFTYGGNNRHLGRKVAFETLSAELQAHIARRIFGDDT
jgi:hypothetical protein